MTGYTAEPFDFEKINQYVITDPGIASEELFRKKKCFFYDTCSFRRHANIRPEKADYILDYIRNQDGIVVITRCILMELASISGKLNPEYIQYIIRISKKKIPVLLIYEEDLFHIMEVCFGTNEQINRYLIWAVRLVKNPVSTITAAFEADKGLKDMILKEKNPGSGLVFKNFFRAVRKCKEAGDNLGEELLGICLYILSNIPGEPDGKFCIITDDKGAGAMIDALFRKIQAAYRGRKIIIFSTPKLVQTLFLEGVLNEKNDIKELLDSGHEGNIAVLGTEIYDLRSREILLSSEELTELIMKPGGIHITF